MKLSLDSDDVIDLCDILFFNKEIRELILLKLQEANERETFEQDDETPLVNIQIDGTKVKKRPGRPKKQNKITIDDNKTELNI
jgi:hypothetical protein